MEITKRPYSLILSKEDFCIVKCTCLQCRGLRNLKVDSKSSLFQFQYQSNNQVLNHETSQTRKRME